jgi:hypothetical protein
MAGEQSDRVPASGKCRGRLNAKASASLILCDAGPAQDAASVRTMANKTVRFWYVTGIAEEIFSNVRLVGSWDRREPEQFAVRGRLFTA